MENLTCKITIEEAWEEYFDNIDFREIIQSDKFVYTGNSYILNNAEQRHGKHMLVFREVEIHEPNGLTIRGDSPSSSSRKRKGKQYDINIQSDLPKEIIELRKATNKQFEKNSIAVKSAWERIYEYLELEGANPQTFHEKTLLSSAYFTKAKHHDNSPPSMHVIVSIVAGYNWGLQRAEELLKLAGHSFSPVYKQHDAYIFVIASMPGYSIDYMNTLLVKEGLIPLGSASYSMK